MIDNDVLENPPSNQNLDSFFILNSNTSTSPSREDIELEQLELRFDPSLATRNQVSFSVDTPQIWKQIRKPPEIFDYKDLNAKFVAMKDEIYDLKLEIKKLKEGIEKMNLKWSSNKNYNQNSFFFFLSELLRSKQNIIDKLLNIQSDQLKTNLTPSEKGDNIIDLNNDSITRIVQVFCRCNDIMSYSGSNTLTNIKQDKRNAQFIKKKLHNMIGIKDNANENLTVGNNKIKEDNKKMVIIDDSMFFYQRSKFLSKK